MLYLTRKEKFNAAHRLFKKEWSAEKNFEIFGKCSNANWHGHNYELLVTVKGEINQTTGFVVNAKELSKIINAFVIEKIDHKNLNLDVEFMKGKIASSENLVIAIWSELEKPIRHIGVELHSIRLMETEKNYVDYFG